MSYDAAITELRQLLADTSTSKRATRKGLIGSVNGDNTIFVSYDKRIIESSVKCYVDGDEVGFSVLDSVSGEIEFEDPPAKNTKPTASYYFQFWVDAEIKNFLNKGAESTGQFGNTVPDNAYLSIQPGLKASALYFASSMAISNLINFLTNRRHSEEFLIQQDGNDDSNFSSMINALNKQVKDYWDKAVYHRDDFYKRLGKRNAPAFGIRMGQTRNYGPRR